MRKLLITVALILLPVCLSAGNGRWGVAGGLSLGSADIHAAFEDARAGNISAYQVGLTWNKPLFLGFRIQPALMYNLNGAVELPVQLQWSPVNVLNIVRPYVFAEAFAGYALDAPPSASEIEYGCSLGLGTDVFKHLQLSVKYFWNVGHLYDFSYQEALDAVMDNRCSGIGASLTFFF